MRWDAGTYGRSFAEVYDDWYGARGDEAAVVAALGRRCLGRRLLELGVGTGRLAIPLAEEGWSVTGVDSSPEMLAILAGKLRRRPASVVTLLDDAGSDPGVPWPAVDVVLAAFNFVFNLSDRAAQRRCFRRAAASGARHFVLEAYVPDPELRSGTTESRLTDGRRIRTTVDAATGSVFGAHIGLDGTERPWRACIASPDELDAIALSSGWQLERRDEDWVGSGFDPTASAAHVSWYARRDA